MSAQLQIVPPSPVDVEGFREYLRANLTSDLVLQVLEECLLQENSTYNPIDFEQALKELQQRDTGRYAMLRLLLEGYATKEGQVMLDPKMVNASYKQRMKELEFLRSLGRFRRFFYRFFQALEGLFTEKNETEAIKEAIQVAGEVQIARDELAIIELKKTQITQELNQKAIEASNEARSKLENADQRASEKSEQVYREARAMVTREREAANGELRKLRQEANKIQAEIAKLNQKKTGLYGQFQGRGTYRSGTADVSYSPSMSTSPSSSLSPSASPSASWDEGDVE
jgi:hypothetical protein